MPSWISSKNSRCWRQNDEGVKKIYRRLGICHAQRARHEVFKGDVGLFLRNLWEDERMDRWSRWVLSWSSELLGLSRGWKQIEMCLNLPNGRFGFYRWLLWYSKIIWNWRVNVLFWYGWKTPVLVGLLGFLLIFTQLSSSPASLLLMEPEIENIWKWFPAKQIQPFFSNCTHCVFFRSWNE